jgi:hypothetical protein
MCGTHTQMRDERSGLLPDNPLVDGSDAWTWCIGVYDRRTPYVGMCGTHTQMRDERSGLLLSNPMHTGPPVT